MFKNKKLHGEFFIPIYQTLGVFNVGHNCFDDDLRILHVDFKILWSGRIVQRDLKTIINYHHLEKKD